jgi:type I restriction enzyme M protein
LSLDTDVKVDACEGLLQTNAEDVKGGAGQYFTPRPLISKSLTSTAVLGWKHAEPAYCKRLC